MMMISYWLAALKEVAR
jgi:hypothetical protein